MMRFDIL